MSKSLIQRLGVEIGALVERSTRSDSEEDLTKYANNPVGFCRDVLQGSPWKAQAEIMRAVRDRPLVAVRSCNAAGKDWTAAALALWWVFAKRGQVLVTGPTERQVREVLMLGEVARAFHRARERLPASELYQMVLRVDGAEDAQGILAFTSTEASKISGFHAGRILVLITEAQAVEEFAYEGLFGCATGPEDRVLCVGNPLLPSGRFYDISRSDSWHSIQISAHHHPNVKEGKELIPGGVSRTFIERMKAEYGESSGVYQARVLGEFPDQGEESLFARSWLDAAADRWTAGTFGAEAAEAAPVLAVDPARYGPDSTVLAVRRGPVIQRLISWRGHGTMETTARIMKEAEALGVRPARPASAYMPEPFGTIVVDSVGLGAGVADRLRQLRFSVSEYNGGEFASSGKRFLNHRAESYWLLKELLEEGKIALPRDSGLFQELLEMKWSPTPEGKVRMEAKVELKRRLGRSPDKADAVCMAFAFRRRRLTIGTFHV